MNSAGTMTIVLGVLELGQGLGRCGSTQGLGARAVCVLQVQVRTAASITTNRSVVRESLVGAACRRHGLHECLQVCKVAQSSTWQVGTAWAVSLGWFLPLSFFGSACKHLLGCSEVVGMVIKVDLVPEQRWEQVSMGPSTPGSWQEFDPSVFPSCILSAWGWSGGSGSY